MFSCGCPRHGKRKAYNDTYQSSQMITKIITRLGTFEFYMENGFSLSRKLLVEFNKKFYKVIMFIKKILKSQIYCKKIKFHHVKIFKKIRIIEELEEVQND